MVQERATGLSPVRSLEAEENSICRDLSTSMSIPAFCTLGLGLVLVRKLFKCLLVNIFCSLGGLRKYYSVYGCRKIRCSPYVLGRSTMQTFYSLHSPILQWNQVPC